VLTEQGVDRGEGALDDALVTSSRLHLIGLVGTGLFG
jgi:hypothetical protein